MKKVIVIFLFLNSLLFSDIIAVVNGLAENYNSFLSLRSVPNGMEIGKLHNGDRVKIIRRRGNWYKVVDLKNSNIGWAYKKYIRIIRYPIGKVHGLAENYNSFLSLRAVPHGREIGKLHNGDRVKIIGKRGNWYKIVDLKNYKIGWVYYKYLYVPRNHTNIYENNINTNINQTTIIQINNIQINDF